VPRYALVNAAAVQEAIGNISEKALLRRLGRLKIP
jgi:hypothetical protein